MRTAALIIFLVAFSNATYAQGFTLLPQVGFENSFTKVKLNDLSSFSPMSGRVAPQASLLLNYSAKSGHGFFAGAATSKSIVNFAFTDPETAMNTYVASTGEMQVRLEGGYLFSSKPIYFSKSKKSSGKAEQSKTTSSKSGCHRTYSSCSKKSGEKQTTKNKGSWMKIQPSLGMAYMPGTGSDLIATDNSGTAGYEYRAGNWNTALLAGAGFEFGKNNTRQFTVSVNYFKGLGNLGTETLTTQNSGKTVVTDFESVASGWNLRVGIPFSLSQKKQVKAAPAAAKPATQAKPKCGQYKPAYRCGRII